MSADVAAVDKSGRDGNLVSLITLVERPIRDLPTRLSTGRRPQEGAVPVILAYDGGERAAYAIEQAPAQIGTERDAIVACVWRPVDVSFKPVPGRRPFCVAKEVERAAHETAAAGVGLARQAGFNACARTIEAAPTWKGLIHLADQWGAA